MAHGVWARKLLCGDLRHVEIVRMINRGIHQQGMFRMYMLFNGRKQKDVDNPNKRRWSVCVEARMFVVEKEEINRCGLPDLCTRHR